MRGLGRVTEVNLRVLRWSLRFAFWIFVRFLLLWWLLG